MSIRINLLPVGNGDCIHIRFEDSRGIHNIVIDSGPASAKRMFRDLLSRIRSAGEVVDLLCFTHIDNDHTKAAAHVFSDRTVDFSFIRQVWLNTGEIPSFHAVASGSANETLMTVDCALHLYDALIKREIPVRGEILAGTYLTIGEAVIRVISPGKEQHNCFMDYWNAKCRDVDMGVGDDTSPTNGDSIAFYLEFEDGYMAFLGDAHVNALMEGMKQELPGKKCLLAKLAHHGSIHNLSTGLLERMNTNCFLISSKSGGMRPSRETIDLIASYHKSEKKVILCNFELKRSEDVPDETEIVNLLDSEYRLEPDVIICAEK